MSADFVDIAYKTGAGRYIQEPGALAHLGAEVLRLGTKAFLLSGVQAWEAVCDPVCKALEKTGVPFELHTFTSPGSYEAAARLAECARAAACDCVVGIGGGRIMDLAKAVAASCESPLIEVPTSIATCAAYTPLSVMYTEEGGFAKIWRYEHEINAVIADTSVLAAEPARLIASGMLDTIAKVHEIAHGGVGLSSAAETAQRFAAFEMAKTNNALLDEFGQAAYDDAAAAQAAGAKYVNNPSAAIERISFVNLALTGIVSSLTRGFHQTALAHKLYEGLRTYYPVEAAPYLHGELVAIGLLMQVAYNGEPERANELCALMRRMDMPCSLEEIGVQAEPGNGQFEQLRAYTASAEFIADEAAQARFNSAFETIWFKN